MAFTSITALKIIRVADKGLLGSERIILRVKAVCNLAHYLVLDSTFDDTGLISELNRHVYWFPSCLVAPGDWVVVYTKDGKNRSNRREDNDRNFFFYWGLDHTVWNQDADCVTLIHTSRVSTKGV